MLFRSNLHSLFLKEAVEIHALCQRYGVPFFVNDNVAVSYTHLMQTYTTQMDAARKGIITPQMEIVAKKEYRTTEEIRPVSYTHLDVYKRQALRHGRRASGLLPVL